MAVFSVDSDAVFSATTAVRGTVDRLESEVAVLMSQLTLLQHSWTGAAAIGFQAVVDRWRAAQHDVEDALAGINAALTAAGHQYADAETAAMGLFR